MSRRVVITGMGTVNPLGNNVEDFWKSIKEGKSGVSPITRFDTEAHQTKIAGQISDFKVTDYIDKREANKMADFTKFAVVGSIEAMNQAGIKEGDYAPERCGTILGVGIGGFEVMEQAYHKLISRGPGRIMPLTIPLLIANEGPANVAIKHDLRGPCYTVTTACSSASDAISNAVMMIQAGKIDMCVTGGSEACITEMAVAGFNRLMALSTNNDNPTEASRPFDKDRDGFVMSEGAGILIIEELESAKKRGATILAEIAGTGQTCDADHLTAPHPEGRGVCAAIKQALADADMKPEDIDYINAHGTSTPVNDPLETKAIKMALGDHAYNLKVSSTKSMTGHLVGAAGGVEAIASVMAIQDSFAPPTINFNEAGEGCDLDYVPNKGVELEINAAMSNTLGFGGHNTILILKKYKD